MDIRKFISDLNDITDSLFPGVERYIVNGGDYINDLVYELRADDRKYRYSPYQLYIQDKDYEKTINEFVDTLQRTFYKTRKEMD